MRFFLAFGFFLALSAFAASHAQQEEGGEKDSPLDFSLDLLSQFRSAIAIGSGSRGIWPVLRNGMFEEGFKNRIRVLYQASQGSEASERALARLSAESIDPLPDALLLSAESYALRAEVELFALGTSLPIVLIGADTGSLSQPKGVLLVGVDAFRTGRLAGGFARLEGFGEVLCLRTRREDPARARLCSGVASGLEREIAMLSVEESDLASVLQEHLAENRQTQLIIVDEGSLLSAVAEASASVSTARLAAFGLARSQRSLLEKSPDRVAFLVDLRPFDQGRRAVKAVNEALLGQEPTSPISLEPRIVLPEDMGPVLYWLGRTR